MKRTWMLALVVAASTACSSPQQRQDSEPELLGAPPKPSEDPFFYVARPPVEAAAETKGTIGEVEPKPKKEEPKPAKKAEPVADPKLEAALTEERAARQNVEADLALARSKAEQLAEENDRLRREADQAMADAKRAQLAAEQAEAAARRAEAERAAAQRSLAAVPPEPSKPKGNSCHSCVRICPEKGGCPKDAELVCGWGSGKNLGDAQKRAKGECDGALNMMRESGAYSRVGGQCPPATCR